MYPQPLPAEALGSDFSWWLLFHPWPSLLAYFYACLYTHTSGWSFSSPCFTDRTAFPGASFLQRAHLVFCPEQESVSVVVVSSLLSSWAFRPWPLKPISSSDPWGPFGFNSWSSLFQLGVSLHLLAPRNFWVELVKRRARKIVFSWEISGCETLKIKPISLRCTSDMYLLYQI